MFVIQVFIIVCGLLNFIYIELCEFRINKNTAHNNSYSSMPANPAHCKFTASQRTGEFAGTAYSLPLAAIILHHPENHRKIADLLFLSHLGRDTLGLHLHYRQR